MLRTAIALFFMIFTPPLLAEEGYVDGNVLKQDCEMAKKIMGMKEEERNNTPIEDMVRARECFEFLQGIHGGISFNNYAIAMQHPNVTPEQLVTIHGICLPPLSNREMIEALEAFFAKHQDKLNMPRELVAGHALRMAYPPEKYCTKDYFENFRQ